VEAKEKQLGTRPERRKRSRGAAWRLRRIELERRGGRRRSSGRSRRGTEEKPWRGEIGTAVRCSDKLFFNSELFFSSSF
jgi:hypothetical protein